MYGIQRKCEELELYVYHINEEYTNKLDENSDVYKCVFTHKMDKAEQLAKHASKVFNKVARDLTLPSTNERDPDQVGPETIETFFKNVERKTKAVYSLDFHACDCKYYKKTVAKQAAEIAKKAKHIYDSTKNEKNLIFNDNENNKKPQMALLYLNERDKHFVKRAITTLGWFQLWYLIHWIFHIFSAFLAVGLLLDAISLLVKARIDHYKPGVLFKNEQIGFLFMLSVVHMFLLLYPCLRAAIVTRTRQRVIQKIAEEYRFSNIPEKVLFKFVEAMNKRRFSFRLRVLCATIPYNLNVAFISIIFGFLGVVVSLVTTITT